MRLRGYLVRSWVKGVEGLGVSRVGGVGPLLAELARYQYCKPRGPTASYAVSLPITAIR